MRRITGTRARMLSISKRKLRNFTTFCVYLFTRQRLIKPLSTFRPLISFLLPQIQSGPLFSDVPKIHINGSADPVINRDAAEGLELRSKAALPDVVNVASGLNDNWER